MHDRIGKKKGEIIKLSHVSESNIVGLPTNSKSHMSAGIEHMHNMN